LHLINNKNLLYSKSPTYEPISTANNTVFIADTKGPIQTVELPLKQAFASDELHENLLSINQLDTENYDTLFSAGKVYIGKGFQIPKKYNVVGHRKNGAYYVTLNKVFKPLTESTLPGPSCLSKAGDKVPAPGRKVKACLLTESNIRTNKSSIATEYPPPPLNTMDMAHTRLGHLHERGIKQAIKNKLLLNLNVNSNDKLNPCLGCITGKARKGTPSRSTTKIFAIGDLIHMDLIGPINPITRSGHRFILTIIDDFSNVAHTWALKNKGEAYKNVVNHVLQVINQHGRVKVIRSDNGGEFTSNAMEAFLLSKGIQHQRTVRCSSFQNGVDERFNLTLLNGMRASHISSGIPLNLWNESMNAVTHSRKYSPSPMAIWNKQKPDFKHLRKRASLLQRK
jgi:transposase InsO family protein